MTEDFYKDRIIDNGIDVMILNKDDIELVNRVIYDELCVGKINEDSRKEYVRIINDMKEKGAEGVILGCTEIGLLIKQSDSSLPVFDTTEIHGKVAVLKSIE